MSNRDLLELIARQVNTLTEDMGEVKLKLTSLENTVKDHGEKLTALDKRMTSLESTLTRIERDHGEKLTALDKRITSLENTLTRIEINHGDKLAALFDGYKTNSEKLDRIENKVSKHEEIILRRIQ